MSDAEIPNYEDLVAATLEAILDEQRGGSASNQEIAEDVAVLLDLSDETLEIPHGKGPRSEFLYRASWARTFLRHMGAIENSTRGVWSVTEKGRSLASSPEAVRESFRETRRQLAREWRSKSQAPKGGSEGGTGEGIGGLEANPDSDLTDDEWQDTLLSVLREMPPDGFERLCQRILREKGFTKVEVTGRAGDGGIDGTGILRLDLISFHVVFQCKRYTGSVGDPEIRNLRGAMAGRGADKGLFLTTGRFSRPAELEATRALPTIELIDGTELCQLLKELQLGVQMVESVDPAFFASFASV